MPELPDLQVFSRNLDKKLSGQIVKAATLVNGAKIKTPAADFKKALVGQELLKVYREGKELRFEFKNGTMLGMHLMLHGNLYFFEKRNEQKFTIFELLFKNNTGLALTDYQRMAKPILNPGPSDAPDSLSTTVNFKFLKEKLGKKTLIKTLLLDQHIIRGIGNAYADEILWTARISPLSVSNKIPDEKIKQLAKAIKSVLKNAEKKILKHSPEIITGEVRDFLDIHNSSKTSSPTGAPIKQEIINSRKTYYTDEQELFV